MRYDDTRDVVLIQRARATLAEAAGAGSASERFRLAHLAALRAAAAALAGRARPGVSRRRLISVWVLLRAVSPEHAAWAALFAAAAPVRAAIEAGATGVVDERRADAQLCAAERFVLFVEEDAGLLAVPLAS